MRQLPEPEAIAIVTVLLPQLVPVLDKAAAGDNRAVIAADDRGAMLFDQVCSFLALFELATELSGKGLRFDASQTITERLAGFDVGRASVLAAWLFPPLRQLYIDGASGAADRALFSKRNQLADIAMAALDDARWSSLQAEALSPTAGQPINLTECATPNVH